MPAEGSFLSSGESARLSPYLCVRLPCPGVFAGQQPIREERGTLCSTSQTSTIDVPGWGA